MPATNNPAIDKIGTAQVDQRVLSTWDLVRKLQIAQMMAAAIATSKMTASVLPTGSCINFSIIGERLGCST